MRDGWMLWGIQSGMTSLFLRTLRERGALVSPSNPTQISSSQIKRWVYVLYDQLHDGIGMLGRWQDLPLAEKQQTGIIYVESSYKANLRPYHKQKLAWVLANGRHFMLEQAAQGYRILYLHVDVDYSDPASPLWEVLRTIKAKTGYAPFCMEAAEREMRMSLDPLYREGLLQKVPHDGWLSTPADFHAVFPSQSKQTYRMDTFYKYMRNKTQILMESVEQTGTHKTAKNTKKMQPVGGQYSFDADNRQPWRGPAKGDPPAPALPTYIPDAITLEVGALIQQFHTQHGGRLDLTQIPATKAQAEQAWRWAKEHCLEHFGPYEDAMSVQPKAGTLFHTKISPLLNLYRLLPKQIVSETEQADIPLSSKEGLIRQILGWREFVRHIHRETDGMRQNLPPAAERIAGDLPLPAFFWDQPKVSPHTVSPHTVSPHQNTPNKSGLYCLDHAIEQVWREGYTHHIVRLMVISNIAQLLGLSARELTDWFWVGYIDAFDWVVEPNVLGMGTYAMGELMITKPYIAGSAYIHKMSDACKVCQFDPKKTCPLTHWYWAFLQRHEHTLSNNGRMLIPLAALKKRSDEQKTEDQRIYETWRSKFAVRVS